MKVKKTIMKMKMYILKFKINKKKCIRLLK